MKYSNLIQDVKDLGYNAVDTELFVRIETTKGDRLLLIDKVEECGVDSVYENFGLIPVKDRGKLFDLACELARTPLEEREEQYHLRLPFISNHRAYLNERCDKLLSMGDKLNRNGYKTIFTKAEIATLKEKHNLDNFIIEEVREDEI